MKPQTNFHIFKVDERITTYDRYEKQNQKGKDSLVESGSNEVSSKGTSDGRKKCKESDKRTQESDSEETGEVSDEDERPNSEPVLSGYSDNTGSEKDSSGSLGKIPKDQGEDIEEGEPSGRKSYRGSDNDTGRIPETEEDTSGSGTTGELGDNGGLGISEGELDSSSRRDPARNYVIRKDSEIVERTYGKIIELY